MFAIAGYAIGRKSSQNLDVVPQRETELEPFALDLAGAPPVREPPAVVTLGVMGRKTKPVPARKSEALPWADRPKSLEGSNFVGDSGFDPLGLFGADPIKLGWDQQFYREAELKHARLGMLAALAYPVQEKLEPVLAKAFNLPDELKETLGRSPSIVNGGLEQGEIPLTIVAFLAGGAIVEYLTDKLKKEQGAEYVVGDIGLPYVGAQTVEQQALRQLQELQFGRVAMVAVLVYVIEESVFRTSVVRETAAIFQELANVKSLETDVAQGVLQAEKSSSAVIQELGNVKQLELDVASLSSKVTEFAKEGEELVVKDLEGSVVETVMNAGAP
jgi:light-harvesting complex II chlorophyll a/b binding protein 5